MPKGPRLFQHKRIGFNHAIIRALPVASANSCSAISLVAPASPKIGPVASAPSLGPAPDSNSWPINFAICAMATLGIIDRVIWAGLVRAALAKMFLTHWWRLTLKG